MKNIFRILMAVAVLFTASCAKEDISTSIAGGEANVTFTVDLPELGTRAETYGKGASATTLRYYVYDGNNYLPAISSESLPNGTVTLNGGKATVTLPLIKGMIYNIVFWADNGSNIYTIDPATKVLTVDYTDAIANDDSRDAFYKYVPAIDPATATKEDTTIVLTRPFAQLNAATNDLTAVANSGVKLNTLTSKVTVKNAYTTLNLVDGTVGDPKQEVTFAATAIPAINDEVLKDGYDYLSMNYVLVNDKKLVEATLTVYGERTTGGEAFPLTVNNYTNVPLQRNYRTNILGSLITKPTEFNVEIKPGFGGTEVVDVWDGKTVTPPAYDVNSKTYTVTNGAELAWIAAAANGTTRSDVDTFIDQTIVLANDIELGGHNWTPISISTELGNGKTFRGTFNGNGKTISGLVSNQKDIAGLFGYIYAATIKNVTIKGASINSNHYAGGIVAWILNNSGNVKSPAIIKNCHVVNSTITSTPELVNGEWDNGDKAGGLVGYACFDNENNERGAGIKNCSVENTTIKAYRDFGGLVGYASYVALENCSVNNITLEQDLTHDYKAPNTPTTYGELIGRNDGGNTIDGADYIANGVICDAEGNYHIYSAEGLKWVADVVNATTPYTTTLFDNKYVYLANDIDLNNMEWIPIGDDRSQRTEFHGIFDGQGHTVKNVKITKKTDRDDDNKSSYGLFGNLKGTVKNLTVENVSISGAPKFIGALVGRMNDGLIENCHVKNSNVTCNNWTIGGLVGQLNNGKISGCSVEKTTVTGYAAVAAIAGIALNKGERTIENCTVKECTLVQNGSFGYGDFDKMFGAIVGALYSGELTVNLVNCNIEQTTIKGEPSNVLCGHIKNGDTLLINGVCLTIVNGYTALFRDNEGDYYLLNKQSLIDWHAFLAKSPTVNPYNCNVKMLADIDADGWTWNSLKITPSAVTKTGLQFDGQNHTISNLKIAGEGMFNSSLAGMAFKNLTIDGVNVASAAHNAAVFAGAAYSRVSFENVAVKNATVNGLCNTGIFVGGTYEPNNLVIRFKDCSVETSSVTAVGYNGQDPTGASGFVGKAYGSTKLVFEGTNSIDDATTITNHNGLVGGKAYGYTVIANGYWTGTGASDEFVNWGGLSYVSDAATLTEALKNGGTVVLSQDVVAEAATTAPYGNNKYAFKMDGGILDGNDHELSMVCYGDDYGVMTSGGTVKNLTIKNGCRAIMIMYPTEDIILDNVNIGGDGVLYPINTGEAGAEGIKLVVTNSTLAGWVSFSNIASASFTNVEFKQGTYYNNIYGRVLRPYVNTTITGCSFVAHMNLDLSKLATGHKITFKNCTVDGKAINAGVFTVPTTDAQYDTELFTVDLPSWASSINDCIVFE